MRLEPSWRQGAGMTLILAWILLWSVGVTSAAPWVAGRNWMIQLAYYATAGLIWIFPLLPLIHWMQTGKIRRTARGPTK